MALMILTALGLLAMITHWWLTDYNEDKDETEEDDDVKRH